MSIASPVSSPIVLGAPAGVAAMAIDRLNPRQLEAATYGATDAQGRFQAGPLLVIAGAGTGKTATLAHRVAHLLLCNVAPERILLLTFSRRAAQEMVRRAGSIAAAELAARGRGSTPRLPWAGTFHAIGARMLRQYAAQVGLNPSFGILDRADAADLLDMIRQEQGLSTRQQRFPRKDTCLSIYSHRVNTGWTLEQVLEKSFPWCAQWHDELRGLFRGYVERKQAEDVLDYDDLLLWWHAAVSDVGLAGEIAGLFDHVLVDEYQDTNTLQAQILLGLRPQGQGLTVVGDDAQSIYAFRAADIGNILGFPERFSPPARRITLDLNYRSVQPVLDAANALIADAARQYPKTLRAHRGGGALPRLVTVLDERAQAEYVVSEILHQRETGVTLKRQAVLFRSSHHSDLLELELTRRNIPYVKHGGLRFLEAAHVKDLLSVLRWAENPRHGIAAFRALQLMNGFGPGHARRGLDYVAAAGHRLQSLMTFTAPPAAGEDWPGFAALMASLAEPTAPWPGQLELARQWYQPVLERRHDDAPVRAADLDMLASVAPQFGSRERFLTELTLDPPQASGDLAGAPLLDEDYLILSTVHSAKGQEWDAVYVLNVADGNFPNEYATGNAEAIEEERRLLYVAMTRARDSLRLVEPLRYHVTGQAHLGDAHVHGARSRFLTRRVLAQLERAGAPLAADGSAGASSAIRVDVAARMRSMW